MQRYTSAGTCRNQMPALHRALLQAGVWVEGDRNADIGGGRFDKATDALRDAGVHNVVYDPHNRSDAHNAKALKAMRSGVSTATVAKVLNAIMEPEIRLDVIKLTAEVVGGGNAYFHVYEGDRSGRGKATRDGWQENRRLASYVPEIARHFRDTRIVSIQGVRAIIACNGV